MSTERITEIIRAFGTAAKRAQQAGFDGIELQYGLGYLISQFLSPATNLRSDGYGGDREHRLRFAREVFESVRGAVGQDYTIAARISASEKTANGLDVEDAAVLARTLEQLGASLVHVVTGSNCETPPWYFQHMALPEGVNESLAARIKMEVAIPVMAAGRLGDPARIREVISSGMVDMVALGRPLLADPDLPRKMRYNRDEDIMLCGHCLQGCLASVATGKSIGCHFNPRVGRESEVESLVTSPRRVVVVGGGPAGMQAALTARRRGHEVVLFEKANLGGQFLLASLPPGKKRLEKPLYSLIVQTKKAGIDIRFEEATPSRIESLRPDVVLIATGSRASVPQGLDAPLTAAEALARDRNEQRVLVLGGGMVGMEVAETLAGRGTQVVVLELLEEVGRDIDAVSRKMMFGRLASLPVDIHTSTELVLFKEGRAIVRHQGEQQDLGEFDDVVIAVGNEPFDILSKALAPGIEVHVIGDARQIGTVGDAIRSAHDIGTTL